MNLGLKLSLATAGRVNAKPEIATIAAMGDSISSGIDYGIVDKMEGSYLWPVFAGTDRAITPVLSSSGRNFQTGGFTAEQIRDTWLPEVITAGPDACVILAGTNGILAATTTHRPDLDAAAASIFVVIAEMATALKTAGITPIIATLTPDDLPTSETWPPSGGFWHVDCRVVRRKINDLIRATTRSLGGVLCDWCKIIATDPDDDASLADSGYMFDTSHPYNSGNQQLGSELLRSIQAGFKITGDAMAIPAADSSLWVTGNPYMSGDSSGLATGWSINRAGSPLPTVGRSKTDAGWQRLTCDDGPNPGTNQSFTLERFIQVTDDQFDGKTYRAMIEIVPAPDDFEYFWILSDLIMGNLDDAGKLNRSRSPTLASSTEIGQMGKLWVYPGKLLLVTPPLIHLGGVDSQRRRITVLNRFWGRGTLDIRVAGVFEVP